MPPPNSRGVGSAEAYVKEAEQKVEAVEASLQKIAEARAAHAFFVL